MRACARACPPAEKQKRRETLCDYIIVDLEVALGVCQPVARVGTIEPLYSRSRVYILYCTRTPCEYYEYIVYIVYIAHPAEAKSESSIKLKY